MKKFIAFSYRLVYLSEDQQSIKTGLFPDSLGLHGLNDKCPLLCRLYAILLSVLEHYIGPCHSPGGQLPASHRCGSGSNPGQIMCDLW
jgi:hypothetical protein